MRAQQQLTPAEPKPVFPDGQIYNALGADEQPPEVDLNNIPKSQPTLTFYIVLPAFKFGDNLALEK